MYPLWFYVLIQKRKKLFSGDLTYERDLMELKEGEGRDGIGIDRRKFFSKPFLFDNYVRSRN